MGYSRSWTTKVKHSLKEAFNVIGPVDPSDMPRDDYIKFVEHLVRTQDNTDYRRQTLSALNRFLARHQNYVFTSVTYKWEPHIPVKVFWLTSPEMGHIWSTPMDPIEKAMIWMMSRLGARRIEVMRQRASEIDMARGQIYLRGKGGAGHKGRVLLIPPSGIEFIPEFNQYREQTIDRLLTQDPEAEAPPEWIIYWTTGKKQKLTVLKPTMADKIVQRVSERSGIQFTAHTMRRTYGRHLFEVGVALPTISKILGHSTSKVTERYLGIHYDDVVKGMMQGEMIVVEAEDDKA